MKVTPQPDTTRRLCQGWGAGNHILSKFTQQLHGSPGTQQRTRTQSGISTSVTASTLHTELTPAMDFQFLAHCN